MPKHILRICQKTNGQCSDVVDVAKIKKKKKIFTAMLARRACERKLLCICFSPSLLSDQRRLPFITFKAYPKDLLLHISHFHHHTWPKSVPTLYCIHLIFTYKSFPKSQSSLPYLQLMLNYSIDRPTRVVLNILSSYFS